MTTNPDDAGIRRILTGVRTIAMVGASNKPDRASHGVMKFLQTRGYRVMPVSPRLAGQTLLGETVHASLADIDTKIDMVDIFVNADGAGAIVDEAIAAGARVVWLQLGVVDEAAAARARAAGLEVVMDRCPAIEWRRLGLSEADLDAG